MPEQMVARAAAEGILLSSFTLTANFIKATAAEGVSEVERGKREADITATAPSSASRTPSSS